MIWSQALILLISLPVIATIHEAGHATLARAAGYRVASFGIGHGRPIFRHRGRAGVTFYMGPRLWMGGACLAIPLSPSPPRRWLYHAGGLIAQALLALALLPLAARWPALEIAARFNALVMCSNLVPWKVGPYTSDGWHLALEAAAAGSAGHLFAFRSKVRRLMRFELEVGSMMGVAWCELMLAWMDLLVGRTEGVAPRLDQDAVVVEPYLDAVQAFLLAELHRQEGRPLGGLAVCRELRGLRGAELSDAAADLLSIAEARAYLALDEPGLANQAIARVAGVSGVVGREALSVLLSTALARGRADEIEVAGRRLEEKIQGLFLDPAEAARALWSAGERLIALERREAGERLRRRAGRAAARMIASAQVSDRVSLVHRIGGAAGVKVRGAARR